jgi:hypothetical protein
MRDG